MLAPVLLWYGHAIKVKNYKILMMSNELPQQKTKSERPQINPRSSEDSTHSPKAPSKAAATTSRSEFSLLQSLLEALQPAIAHVNEQAEFHRALEGASQFDARILWDVRVIRGVSTPVAHLKGSSHLPGAFSDKMRHNAAAALQQEIIDKVAMPMTGRIMEEEERMAREAKLTLAETRPPAPTASTQVDLENIQQMAIAAAAQEASERKAATATGGAS